MPDPFPPPAYTVERSMIDHAREIVRKYNLVTTRMVHSPSLTDLVGRPVYLKCENEQFTGAFKVRGALTRLSVMGREERARGVVASSAGNHGLGLAWACRHMGIPGLVVVPASVPQVKRVKLQEMMIKLRVHGENYDEAEAYARQLAIEAEATFVSPFDDPWVMAGNGGTVGLEIREQLPECSAVVTPVGGGGLASGLVAALEGIPVMGVNTAASPAMARSLAEGRENHQFPSAPTLAEGLEGGVSDVTVALCARHLHSMEVVSEELIAAAIRLMVKNHSMIIEGSAAVGVAALLGRRPVPGKGPLCVLLTGRNIDRERLKRLLTSG